MKKIIHPSEEVSGRFDCYYLIDLPEEHQVWFFLDTKDGPEIVVHNYSDDDGHQWRGSKTPFTIKFSRKGMVIP